MSPVCVELSDTMKGLAGPTSALSKECPGCYGSKLATEPLWRLLQPICLFIPHIRDAHLGPSLFSSEVFPGNTQTRQDVAWSLSWRTGLVEKVLLSFLGTLGLQGYKENI